ncbi:MAG: hypothetical protein H8D23_29695 [Candidatus Brocadiales bacterium]|nr:hypothetical protein [Candidatus Brocadiales bacterium]
MAKTKSTKISKISAKKKAAKKEPKSKNISKKKTSPSTKKQNKPAKKTGLAQWVLDFLNLRSEPGEQNINKLPADVRKKLRWLPQHPTKRMSAKKKSEFERKEALEVKEAVEKLQDQTLSTHQQYEYTKKVETYVDDKGNVFSRKTKELVGIEQCCPTLEDFKQFFLDKGIPPLKGTELLLGNSKPLKSLNTKLKYPETWYTPTYDDYSFELKLLTQISRVWEDLCRILGNMAYDTKTYDNEGTADESFDGFRDIIKEEYIECLEEDEIPFKSGYSKNREVAFKGIIDIILDGGRGVAPFPHCGMLPQAIYACILDFSYNHKGILSRLKQCPLCGEFRIEKRKRKYCSDECKDRFNRPDRDANTTIQRRRRKVKKGNEQVALKKKIQAAREPSINWLQEEHDIPKKEAEDIFDSTPPEYKTSLGVFKRSI